MPTYVKAVTAGDAIFHYRAVPPGATEEQWFTVVLPLSAGMYYTLPDELEGYLHGFAVERITYTGRVELDVTYEEAVAAEAEAAAAAIAAAKAEIDEALDRFVVAKRELAEVTAALDELKAASASLSGEVGDAGPRNESQRVLASE